MFSKELLLNRDPYEMMRLAYTANPRGFKYQALRRGITVRSHEDIGVVLDELEASDVRNNRMNGDKLAFEFFLSDMVISVQKLKAVLSVDGKALETQAVAQAQRVRNKYYNDPLANFETA